MKVVIIGGTGHVGTYLVPRLVQKGHEVISISRQKREPYQPHKAWLSVKHIEVDRVESEKLGEFGKFVEKLSPEVVIDMICFKPESAKQLVEALKGRVQHFIHCGTIWVHGPSERVPTDENQPRHPFGEYGVNKAAIEAYLLSEARQNGFPATILHPGHIVGPGWIPLNPAGNFNPDVFRRLAHGDTLYLPNLGLETIHHVHADDVAQAFVQAVGTWNRAVGESFHVVSQQALTLRGYAEAIAKWFGQKPSLKFLPWEDWKKTVPKEDAQATWDHIAHSPSCSIAKAQKLLNYQPRYTSLQAVEESVQWLIDYDDLLSG